jgi:hypothetical protein
LPVILFTLCFLFFSTRSLAAYYFDPKYARDDYRGLVQYIENNRQSGDAVILEAPGQAEVFGYYSGRLAPGLSIYPFPRQRPINTEMTLADMSDIFTRYNRVWTVYWAVEEADSDGVISAWLDEHAKLNERRYYGTVQMDLYSLEAIQR